jgi:hypothetical protein
MTPVERELYRKRCFSRAVDVLHKANVDDLGDLVASLIWELDSACQQRLVSGRNDLFG